MSGKEKIRSLDQHKSTCLHVPVPCPRECDVGSVLRGDLQSHLRDYCSQRDYECPHCLQMGRYSERVTSHLEDCFMVPTECPNEGCEEMVPHSLVQAHLDEDCPFTVLKCQYSDFGCEAELPRRDLKEHGDDHQFHLQVIAKTSQRKITALQTSVQRLTAALQASSIPFKVTEYQRMNSFDSPSFYTGPNGYKMHIRVRSNPPHIAVHAVLEKGENNNKLSWPFVGDVTVTLLNQLEDKNHYIKTIKIK